VIRLRIADFGMMSPTNQAQQENKNETTAGTEESKEPLTLKSHDAL